MRFFLQAFVIGFLLMNLRAPLAGVVETKNFRFVFDEGTQGVAETLARIADEKSRYVSKILGIVIEPSRIEVRIASSDDAMAEMAGSQGRIREWVAGLAFPERYLIVLSARGNEVFSIVDTFEHELAHLYLGLELQGRFVPRWFQEGLAMLVASESVGERLKTALNAAASDAWLSFEDLTYDFPEEQPAVQLAYAQSMLFVRFLHRVSEGKGPMAVVRKVSMGAAFEDAFLMVFGGTVEEMWLRAKAGIGRVSSWIWVATTGGLLWLAITALFLYAYVRKKRQTAIRRKALALLEQKVERQKSERVSDRRIFVVPGPKDIQ